MIWCFAKTEFCHQSGRHWPDLHDTSGFEAWSLGPHFGPILGPRGAQKHPEKKTNTILKDPFKIKNCFSALAISASSARRFFPLLTCAGAGHIYIYIYIYIYICVCGGGHGPPQIPIHLQGLGARAAEKPCKLTGVSAALVPQPPHIHRDVGRSPGAPHGRWW